MLKFNISQGLRKFTANTHIPVERVALRLGISPNRVRQLRMPSMKVKSDTVVKYAQLLRVRVEYLVGEKGAREIREWEEGREERERVKRKYYTKVDEAKVTGCGVDFVLSMLAREGNGDYLGGEGDRLSAYTVERGMSKKPAKSKNGAWRTVKGETARGNGR